jgi:hypothetical protein
MMGAGLMLMVLVPNPLWGRLLFAACAGAILLVGYLLKRSAGALPQAKPILKPSMASRSAS